ncbi:MAG: ABC transporter substrate-binding protein [Phycisphaerales bacterium]|nr:ABC transporter substrate-binding protein [Phycisphaerales bacterium]
MKKSKIENRKFSGFWLLASGFWLLMLLTSCGRGDEAESEKELIIISPHGSDIRYEFSHAFSQWHQKKYGSPVNVKWPDIGGGGTGNIVRYLDQAYQEGGSPGYDLLFGGGSYTYTIYQAKNYLVKPDLPAEVLARVPKDIFSTPLHGAGDSWIAATMSNFGITYNKDRIAELGLQVPRTWEDLTGPQWIGLMSLSDPSKSGSVRSSYDQIFMQYGWEKGWRSIVLMFANTDNIRDSGSAPADDVGSAQAVAGIVIDFYGRKAILRAGESICGFVIPDGGSITDPDPIAMLRGAPHPEIASHFIEFVISEEGQKLWTFRVGTPGGPKKYVLGRLSVLPEMYEKYRDEMFDPVSPFTSAAALKADISSKWRNDFIGELIRSALIENIEALRSARRAVHAAGDPPELLAKLTAPPTFIPTKVVNGKLEDQPPRPITASDQQAVAAEFKPKDNVRKPQTERLQQRLMDLWQREFLQRCKEVEKLAKYR